MSSAPSSASGVSSHASVASNSISGTQTYFSNGYPSSWKYHEYISELSAIEMFGPLEPNGRGLTNAEISRKLTKQFFTSAIVLFAICIILTTVFLFKYYHII